MLFFNTVLCKSTLLEENIILRSCFNSRLFCSFFKGNWSDSFSYSILIAFSGTMLCLMGRWLTNSVCWTATKGNPFHFVHFLSKFLECRLHDPSWGGSIQCWSPALPRHAPPDAPNSPEGAIFKLGVKVLTIWLQQALCSSFSSVLFWCNSSFGVYLLPLETDWGRGSRVCNTNLRLNHPISIFVTVYCLLSELSWHMNKKEIMHLWLSL